MIKLIPILTLLLFISVLNAQKPAIKCGTMEYLQQQKISDPNLKAKMLLHEEQTQQWIREYYNPDSLKIITIPVVVHIVYNTDEQNLPDSRVFEQIDMLNRDYAGLNNHSMEGFPGSLKANTGIQFCLAQQAPDGTLTNGIERRYTTDTSFTTDNDIKFYSTGGLDAWDPTLYFNIWVCNYETGTGYAQFPGLGEIVTYGVVIGYWAFGATGTLPSSYRNNGNGGVTTHEIGHCLNLRHIWGDDDGECYGTDNCDDTPNQANPTYGYNSGLIIDLCTPEYPGIMYMNFMDYSDDSVFANFTPDQTARIQACFASPNGHLVSLANSDACSPPTFIETPTFLASTEVVLFPNPTEDIITITGITGEATIYNVMGREVWRGKISDMGKISVCDFNPGLYYIVTEESAKTKKFVIIK